MNLICEVVSQMERVDFLHLEIAQYVLGGIEKILFANVRVRLTSAVKDC